MYRENPKDFNWPMINDDWVERVRSNVKAKQSDFKV
jgi:hypothetical protein